MPQMIQFMLTHFIDGAVLGLAVALAILWGDVGHIRQLLEGATYSGLLTALFFLQAGLLFGTLGMNVALMNLGND